MRTKYYSVSDRSKAWALAERLFPTDYMQDAYASQNAGYPVFWSTSEGCNAWISDLNTSLELNLPDGQTITICIEKSDSWEYDGQY